MGEQLYDDSIVSAEWRTAYTLEQVNNGEISDKITLNSIKDFEIEAISVTNDLGSYISDERQFMNIKEKAPKIIWYSSEQSSSFDCKIKVEEGKVYRVRIFVHNNNPYGARMTAVDTTAWVGISSDIAEEVSMTAYLSATNATPGYGGDDGIYDNVTLVSKDGRKFSIAYVPGSVEYRNNWTIGAFESSGYAPLSDYLFTNSGVKLGYNNYDYETQAFDGDLPGGYEYSGWLFFDVIPQFQD